MRIKHFQGYGRVNAVKKYFHTDQRGIHHLTVDVTGDHEWGLEFSFHDEYGVFNWLVKQHFDKQAEYDYSRVDYSCEVIDRTHVVYRIQY